MNDRAFPFKKRENPLAASPKTSILSEREKYTATMEKEMRIRVKIAAAKRGTQFSQYIEQAVLEKLEREGD